MTILTVQQQITELRSTADELEAIAHSMADVLVTLASEPDAVTESECAMELESCKEELLLHIESLRCAATALQHQEDTVNTQRLHLRDLAALRRIHG